MPSALQIWLQRQIASQTFPPNREDWYVKNGFGNSTMTLEERFAAFVGKVYEPDSPYFEHLATIELSRSEVEVTLANQKKCLTEMVRFFGNPDRLRPDDQPKPPGTGRHILYFTGVGSLYQDCLVDIATAVKTTGATYYAFEYPGMSKLGGEVLEVNDMVNTGIALTNDLLQKGIPIDDILFQGDSFGAAIAKKVRDQFTQQSGVTIRCIMNNTFSTFQLAAEGMVGPTSIFRHAVAPLLSYTGWNIRTSDSYGHDTPYQIHVNHVGDLMLGVGHATLAEWVQSHSQKADFVDPCPEDYRAIRDSYQQFHWASLSEKGSNYLATKYGRNKDGLLDAHLADLYLLKYDSGLGVYESFICTYLQDSNAYVAHHPQVFALDKLPQPLRSETTSLFQLVASIVPSRPSLCGLFKRSTGEAVKQEMSTANPTPKI